MIRINQATIIDKYIHCVDDVLIVGDRIARIGKEAVDAYLRTAPGEARILSGKGKYLAPSLVDLHFHLRNPGQEYKQTYQEASDACIRGGYTKVVAMANTKPVADCAEVIDEVQEEMKALPLEVIQAAAVTVGLKGEEPVDFEALREKTFVFSDDGRNVDSAEVMEQALIRSRELDFIIMDHDEPETEMVIRNIELAKRTMGRIHFCHISKKESIAAIAEAMKECPSISFEVSPHHIFASDLTYRVNPPIGDEEDNQAILEAIKSGAVNAIATDHAPHSEEDKEKGAPGIATIETAFGMVRRIFAQNGISIRKQIELMSNNPSELLGEDNRIREGARADLILFDDEKYVIDKHSFVTRSKNTPFDKMTAQGRILYTIVGGILYDHERA